MYFKNKILKIIFIGIILMTLIPSKSYASDEVTILQESQFSITIPKEIILDGHSGEANYIVNAKGSISNEQILTVIPDTEFKLKEKGGKEDIVAYITQDNNSYTYNEMLGEGTDYSGKILTTLTAGRWEGNFNFNIDFQGPDHIHYYKGIITKNATCIEKGIKTFTCQGCYDSYVEDIGAIGHNYISHTVDPTHEEDGYIEYICENCEDSYKDSEISAVGHNFIPEVTLAPTCIENGIETYICNCGKSYTKTIQPTGHNYIVETINPTCIDNGYDIHSCTNYNCNDKYIDNIILAFGHNYDIGVIIKESTYYEQGEKKYTCEECNDYYIEYIDKLPLPEIGQSLENYSWDEISAISKAGLANNYFDINDTKEVIINNQKYNVRIIGFNHDDLVDENGNLTGEKAGITFEFSLLNEKDCLDSSDYNTGGWAEFEIREKLNTTFYNSLPKDLQNNIQTVNKISDIGNDNNKDLVTTEDKIFLLSFEEVGFTSKDTNKFVPGQGEPYEAYNNNNSREKGGKWWLRSCQAPTTKYAYNVGTDGEWTKDSTDEKYFIAPCFCI